MARAEGLGPLIAGFGAVDPETVAVLQRSRALDIQQREMDAMEAWRRSQMGLWSARLAAELQKMRRPDLVGPGTFERLPSGEYVQRTPFTPKEKAPPKGLEEIEAEAAARARGTASVEKPQKMPVSDFGVFYAAGKAKGWDDARISQEWHKQKVAETTRIQIAGAEARGRAYGYNRPLTVLDTQQGNRPIYTTLGEIRQSDPTGRRYLPATSADRALRSTALIEEIRGSANDLLLALNKMPEFSAAQVAQLAAASKADPTGGVLSNLLRSQFAASLSPEQVDYLTAVISLKESSFALRTVLGAGQGSDLLREAIANTVPSPATPSKAFARRQVEVLRVQIDRLERGIPSVELRPAPEPPKAVREQGRAGIVRRPRARNPKTGEVLEYDGTQWVPAGR